MRRQTPSARVLLPPRPLPGAQPPAAATRPRAHCLPVSQADGRTDVATDARDGCASPMRARTRTNAQAHAPRSHACACFCAHRTRCVGSDAHPCADHISADDPFAFGCAGTFALVHTLPPTNPATTTATHPRTHTHTHTHTDPRRGAFARACCAGSGSHAAAQPTGACGVGVLVGTQRTAAGPEPQSCPSGPIRSRRRCDARVCVCGRARMCVCACVCVCVCV